MTKNSTIQIQAGCRVAGYISSASKKHNVIEVFDVLEVTDNEHYRCHKIGTKFDQSDRNIYLQEHQLNWCRLSNGKEFYRKSTEENWQELNPPIGKTEKSLSESLIPIFRKNTNTKK